MTDVEEIAQLKAQQQLQTLALQQIVEGKWTGASGAAGTIVALMGGVAPANFAPLEYADPKATSH